MDSQRADHPPNASLIPRTYLEINLNPDRRPTVPIWPGRALSIADVDQRGSTWIPPPPIFSSVPLGISVPHIKAIVAEEGTTTTTPTTTVPGVFSHGSFSMQLPRLSRSTDVDRIHAWSRGCGAVPGVRSCQRVSKLSRSPCTGTRCESTSHRPLVRPRFLANSPFYRYLPDTCTFRSLRSPRDAPSRRATWPGRLLTEMVTLLEPSFRSCPAAVTPPFQTSPLIFRAAAGTFTFAMGAGSFSAQGGKFRSGKIG